MNRATSPTGWVRNPDGTLGYTWNPITGCLNGCEYCYARKLANTRLRERYLANKNVAPLVDGWFHDFGKDGYVDSRYDAPFYPRFWEDRLSDKGLGMCESPPKKSWGIFTCDMSDLFGIGIPGDWTRMVLNVIQANPWHRFYLLTKQSQNLIKWSPYPPNCYVGVSATNQQQFDEAVRYLKEVEATVKYISFEPLQERISVSS